MYDSVLVRQPWRHDTSFFFFMMRSIITNEFPVFSIYPSETRLNKVGQNNLVERDLLTPFPHKTSMVDNPNARN